MPATGPDQAKLRLISRSPLPRVPSIRLSAGTRALSKMISALGVSRCPIFEIRLYVTPGVPRSIITADRPSVPPLSGSVRTTTMLAFAPLPSQPATLHGQYLSAVEHVLVAVERGGDADADRARQRRVEVRRPAGRARRLARRVADDVLAARVRGRRAQEPVLLLLGAVVPDRQQAEPVDEHRAGEARVDGADLLGGDDQVDVAHAAAAVLLRQHAERDARLVGRDVGLLRHLEGAQRVGLLVGRPDHRPERVLGEVTHARLQLALLVGQGEVDGHRSSAPPQVGGNGQAAGFQRGVDPFAISGGLRGVAIRRRASATAASSAARRATTAGARERGRSGPR